MLIAAATFVVVASLRTLWRMLRVTRETVDDGSMASIEGSRVTLAGLPGDHSGGSHRIPTHRPAACGPRRRDPAAGGALDGVVSAAQVEPSVAFVLLGLIAGGGAVLAATRVHRPSSSEPRRTQPQPRIVMGLSPLLS